jgi:hypothetical protein
VPVHLYVTPADFRNSVSLPDGLGEDDAERALAAASGAVQEMTSRRFWLDPEDVTRVYTAQTRRLCMVDDLAVLTSVEVDGAALDLANVLREPANANADGKPYLWLTSRTNVFTCDEQAIAVTGRFGWPEVPSQVEQFVHIVAAKLLKRTREAPFGVVNPSGLEGQAIRLAREDPDAMLLVRRLSRHVPVVA